jgi:hypothetical protein
MSKNWSIVLGLVVIVLAIIVGIHSLRGTKLSDPTTASTPQVVAPSPPATPFSVARWEKASGQNMSDFQERFEKRFKPAITKWCEVYKGRLPFSASDVTIDKFHSKVGGFVYTFMIGDTTFSVYDGPEGTRVFYMMTRQAAKELNSVPSGAVQPDISTPITRQEIVVLLKADSEVDFPADQISIHPTGTFSSMPGGVSVEAGGIPGNNVYRIMTRTNLDFVLDGSGQLVSYQH